MATYRTKLEWWADYFKSDSTLVSLTVLDRYPVRVQEPLRNATIALDAKLRASGYRTPCGPIGSYYPRLIAGTDLWSLHSYGIAIDIDYGDNPHLREPIPRGFGTDERFEITEAQVNAVESIVNDQGDPIWKWLGWSIGDTMHFEADQPPNLCEPRSNDMDYRGVKNVPDETWAKSVVDWGIEAGIIVTDDNVPDDWEKLAMKDGRLWTFLSRFDQYLERKWS